MAVYFLLHFPSSYPARQLAGILIRWCSDFPLFKKSDCPSTLIGIEYIKFLGTDDLSSEDFQQELYKLGCSVSQNVTDQRLAITLSGLSSNFDTSVELFETLLLSCVADEEALKNLKLAKLKQRADDKLM